MELKARPSTGVIQKDDPPALCVPTAARLVPSLAKSQLLAFDWPFIFV